MNKSPHAPAKTHGIGCDEFRISHKHQTPAGYNSHQDKVNDDDAFPIVVVIVYNDLHAALRASHTLERLQDNFQGKMRRRLIAMPTNQLNDPATLTTCYSKPIRLT